LVKINFDQKNILQIKFQKIIRKHSMNTFFSLLNTLELLKQNGDWQSILVHIANTVINHNKNRNNEGLVYGSPEIDQFLHDAGVLALGNHQTLAAPTYDENLAVHIATELHPVGGHSGALKDVIRSMSGKRHVILLTNLFEALDEATTSANLSDILSPSVSFKLAPKGLGDKLLWAQRELKELRPGTLTLFNHHWDSVAIAAALPTLALNTFYVHHCDHNFALGLFIKHAYHVDSHAINHRTCRHFLGVMNQIYWPLVAQDLGPRMDHVYLRDGNLKTCSHGGMHKFTAQERITYFELIALRLKTASGTHEHIGNLTDELKHIFVHTLASQNISTDRLIFTQNVPSIWLHLKNSLIDLCISSFPEQGGKGNIETMGAGIPILIHESSISPTRSSPNLVYPTAYTWRTPSDFMAALNALSSETLNIHSIKSRYFYENWHHPRELHYAVNNPRFTAPLPTIRSQMTDTYALSCN